MVGRILGPYRILEKLGEGGMGEVYRARDTRLNRDVAIKVLPDAFADDHERLARFSREAETLATLNHPNIAQVYGFEADGAARAIVMELVAGRTLADVIAKRPMAPADALPVARQIALALEAAHERGIVHRDLKPGNIMITGDGVVKVLDFGLARTFDASDAPDPSSTTIARAPTAMSPPAITHIGTVLGTAAYMAPEQARGKPVDKRADLWAFGCVLYEMLTGTVAFQGEDAAGTLARVLEQPPDYGALPSGTPAPIRRLLQRCLAKDRHARIGDASTARLEIDEALHGPATGSGPTRAHPPWWWRSVPWPLAAVAVAAAIAVPLWRGTREVTPAAAVSRFDIALPPGDTFREYADTDHTGLALSGDGRTLYYSALRNGVPYAFRRRFDDDEPELIAGTDGASPLFVTPAHDWLVFGTLRPPMLKKVSLSGGPPVPIATTRTQVLGIASLPSGEFVFGDHSAGIFRAPAAGGATVPVLEVDESGPQRFPVVLPDNRGLLFTVGGVPLGNRIAVLPTGASQPRYLTNGTDARYLPTGHIVFWRDRSLFAASFDLSRLEIVGDAVPVVERVQVRGTGAAAFAWAPNGTLAYIHDVKPPDRRLVWIDQRGNETPLDAPPGPYAAPRLSPDNQKVVVSYRTNATEDIWLHDIARKVTEPFVAEPVSEWQADWTADGQKVLFTSRRAGPFGLYARRADGLGEVERIADRLANTLGLTPGGRELLFYDASNGLSAVDLRAGTRRTLLPVGSEILSARISPDGRWLVYCSAEVGSQDQIWVRPYPDVQSHRWRISTGGGRQPQWSADGRTIFFRHGADMMSVAVRTAPTFSHDPPVLLFSGPYAPNYDLARDGRFLMIKEPTNPPPVENRIIVVLNWFDDLRARLRPSNRQ